MTALEEIIVKALRKKKDSKSISEIYKIVTDITETYDAPTDSMKRGIKNVLATMSNREIGVKYDVLKNQGLI